MKNYKLLKDKEFWIYLAGFIDGEGCIYIAKGKSKNKIGWQCTLRLEIAQSDKEFLEEIKKRIGFGSNVWNKNRKDTNKDNYALKLSSRQAYKVILKIYPYLIIKKEQARYAIEFQELVNGLFGSGIELPKEYWEKQEELRSRLKDLKISTLT